MSEEITNEIKQPIRDYRPWGYYDILSEADHFKIKKIVVNPGGKLSLQMHKFRAEHWIITKGVAQVTCDENIFSLSANQSTFIPTGAKHRLENVSADILELIEIQTGNYFGEDDIIRFEDIYKRT